MSLAFAAFFVRSSTAQGACRRALSSAAAASTTLSPGSYNATASLTRFYGLDHQSSSLSLRLFSTNNNNDSSSHDDFAPKRAAAPAGTDEALSMISDHVKSNAVMLYMKGSPAQPQCGFSAKVVDILKKEGIDFSSVNVLDYPSIREGVKKFSQWPTVPQLYVNAEFVGGCDIVTDMHKSGELTELLKTVPKTTESQA